MDECGRREGPEGSSFSSVSTIIFRNQIDKTAVRCRLCTDAEDHLTHCDNGQNEEERKKASMVSSSADHFE